MLLCYQVLTAWQCWLTYVSYTYAIANTFVEIICIYVIEVPQLSGTPTLTHDTTSIMVLWTHPKFLPDNYTVSYSCQLLCDSQTPSVQTYTVIGTVNNHIISSLSAGSSCTVSVRAAFDSKNGNTITSSTNTSTAGIQYTSNI